MLRFVNLVIELVLWKFNGRRGRIERLDLDKVVRWFIGTV